MTLGSPHFERITPIADCGSHRAIVQQAIDKPYNLNAPWVRATGLVAVPVEAAGALTKTDVERLVFACKRLGYTRSVAVATEPLEGISECYSIELSEFGISEFSNNFGHLCFALILDNGAAIVLFTTDYNLVCGPTPFVEDVTGMSVAEACRQFEIYAADESLPSKTRESLLAIHRTYCPSQGPLH